jgi:hypothetical protein
MKKIFILFAAIVLYTGNLAYSQCNNYYNLDEDTEFEMTSYDPKGKEEGKMSNKVIKMDQAGNNYTATIKSSLFDKKGKMVQEGEYDMICKDGVMEIDMQRFIPQESLKAMGGGDAKLVIDGNTLQIPSSLSVGQTLKDGTIELKMEAGQGGMMTFNTVVNIKNRKVAGKEQITTPAGTFDCFKITYEVESVSRIMGMNMTNSMSSIDYLSEGTGMIKTENFDKKGKLSGYTLLTKFVP